MPVVPHYRRERAPTVNDDRTQQIFKDSIWLDDSANRLYRSDNDSPGAAVWTDITPPSGGGGGPVHWNDVQGKPSTFTPTLPHAHGNPNDIPTLPMAKVDSLESTLTAKAEAAAVQAQLDGKESLSAKGQANGYAGLGADGKVPSAQLPPSAGPFTVVKKSADQTNATTTLANVTGMLVPLLANTDYWIEGLFVMRSSATTTGFKFAFDVPAGAALVVGNYLHVLAATGTLTGGGQRADAVNAGLTSGVDTANADVLVPACFLIRNGPNAGNAQLMFAAEAAGTVTFRQGSPMRSMAV